MRFGITGNTDKDNIAEILAELVNFLKENNIEYCIDDTLSGKLTSSDRSKDVLSCEAVLNSSDVIVSLGGDGTFLNTARLVGKRNIPILGVNMGNLGFMAEVAPPDMKAFIKDIIKKKYRISERAVLCGKMPTGDDYYAVNDIVIDRARSIRMLEIEVFYNDEFVVKFLADGAIISTPTGSTGYSLSAGGPIITQGSEVFILTPICPHTLNVRPIIFPDSGHIMVRVKKEKDVRITADGQLSTELKSPAEFHLKKADYKIQILKKVKSSYYKTLNKKLLWGEDKRKN